MAGTQQPLPQVVLDRRGFDAALPTRFREPHAPWSYRVGRYGESKEKLYAYASALDTSRRRAWVIMKRKEKKSRQHVGLWHGTYMVPGGGCEAICADMPVHGLAGATGALPPGGGLSRAPLVRGARF
ncbi:monooxygenase family protein [Streptomyces sp. NPDC014685]|uniref:monooxygenase family protein n=1 Tax=Streptomyces sp. NPDC014685 TaxID=3364881 RepID=UPI0036FBF76E